jgi:phenylalanine-4-hydroxylase
MAADHPPPQAYSAEDDRTWQKVRDPLFRLHDRYACSDYLRSRSAVLPAGAAGVPQPGDVSRRLAGATGFRIVPAAGVVPGKEFFENLRAGRFTAMPGVRPGEEWRFCSAPDWLHEAVGHAASLGDPRVAELYRLFGEAAARAASADDFRRLGRLYWFTCEAGLVREGGQVKAFGAAVLSSLTEIEHFRSGELRPFDPLAVVSTRYDYKRPQPLYFVADSADRLLADARAYLAAFNGGGQ